MGREALLESLRARAAEDREAVWAEARASAERHRVELARVGEAERVSASQAAAALEQVLASEAEIDARRLARERRARAALALAERCRQLAIAELPRLRESGGPALFTALAQEAPTLAWERVSVNPADADLARKIFPHAEVASDPKISGGMALEVDGGRIRIGNTLDTRLATAWPDILPQLVGGLLPENLDDAAAP
jgi:vacuolar-type H+-ATPase subunit E/Vma4